VNRTDGACSGMHRGLGNCCQSACSRSGARRHPTSCSCLCSKGFVGRECDVTAPHFAVQVQEAYRISTRLVLTAPQPLCPGACMVLSEVPFSPRSACSVYNVQSNGCGLGGAGRVGRVGPRTGQPALAARRPLGALVHQQQQLGVWRLGHTHPVGNLYGPIIALSERAWADPDLKPGNGRGWRRPVLRVATGKATEQR